MGIKTAIEYCDSSINPIMGCSGCSLYHPDSARNHCYAATLIRRYAGRKGWPDKFTEPKHFPERLQKAIGWPDLTGAKRLDKPWLDGMPRVIFVNDLSDGFCPDANPQEWLAPHLEAMGKSPHIWLLLTKWPDNMLGFCEDPLPSNVWPGTTVTQQQDCWRIGWLRHVPAGKHWVSAEPLLGAIHFDRVDLAHRAISGISWIVIGGETGLGARPMRPEWARGIRDQVVAADVPFFFKSYGEWLDASILIEAGLNSWSSNYPERDGFIRVGKKQAGWWLNDREWREMPEVHHAG